MFFKRFLFLMTFLFCTTHCGLELYEESIDPSIYKIIDEGEYFCDVINYKDELKSYINTTEYKVSNERIKEVFDCLRFKINHYKKSVVGSHQNYFTDQEILKLLKEPFVYSEGAVSIIDTITNSSYYSHLLNFKYSLFSVMLKYQNKKHVDFNGGVCPKRDEQALSIEEIDTFIVFLKDFSDFLTSLNVDSERLFYFFHEVFDVSSLEEDQLLSSFKTIVKNKLWDTDSGFFQKISEEKLETVLKSLVSLLLNYKFSDKQDVLTRGSIKYLLINIHLVELMFDLYDKDDNSLLEQEELLNTFCLFKPFISLFLAFYLEKNYLTIDSTSDHFSKFSFFFFFTEEVVFDYILKYGEVPRKIDWELIKVKFNPHGIVKKSSLDQADLSLLFNHLSEVLTQ